MSDGTRQVPASALRFNVPAFELASNGESAKSAPFRMVARTGQPIEHWFWGNVVHDLDGMRLHKQRVPIDYAHDSKEVIGYANKFDVESGDLVVSGALVPFKDSDRATEIIHKQREGVPYEASINFGGDGIRLEEVRDGQSVQVNGYQFSGPGVVIREWPLRGIAVCPYGADANTSTEFDSSSQFTVRITEAAMPAEQETELTAAHLEEAQTTEDTQQEAEAPAVEAAQPAEIDTAAEAVTEEVAAVDVAAHELTNRVTEGQRFLEAFGDQGGVWFAQGKSFGEATSLYITALREENEQLKQRLSAKRGEGESEPVEFSQHVPPTPKAKAIRIAGGR
jgi:hypothetical protein